MVTQTTQAQAVRLDEPERYVSESLWAMGMRRLRRDRLTLLAIGVIVILGVLSVGAPAISEYILHVDPNRTDIGNKFLPIGGRATGWGRTTWAAITLRGCCTPDRSRWGSGLAQPF
jgi:hypothetical protein